MKSYSDYLNYLEHHLSKQPNNKQKEIREREIIALRNHTANATIMQKHLRNYKVLRDLNICFDE